MRASLGAAEACDVQATIPGSAAPNLLHFLILTVAGRLQREQQAAIVYLQAENAVLRAHIPGKRIRFTDAQRRRLARGGEGLSARTRREFATLVTPDTLMRWCRLGDHPKPASDRHLKSGQS